MCGAFQFLNNQFMFCFELFQDMMIAGTDTTAVVSEWAMLELILHPQLMQRAQEEIDKVVGTDRVLEEADLPKLLFLQAFVKETLRMHPPIAVNMPREATQPATVMGYEFPARTQLIMNIYSIHRDPSVYENPHSFNPDRFLETSGFCNHHFTLFCNCCSSFIKSYPLNELDLVAKSVKKMNSTISYVTWLANVGNGYSSIIKKRFILHACL